MAGRAGDAGSDMCQVTIIHSTREGPKVQRLTVVITVMVVVVLLTASVATAQVARYRALGGAGMARADDAGAALMNPANLGVLNISYDDQMKGDRDWEFEAAGTMEVTNVLDMWSANFAGSPIGRSWGVGGAYAEATPGLAEHEWWTLGFGLSNTEGTWAAGVSVSDWDYRDPQMNVDQRWVDLGVLYRTKDANWAVTAEDIGDERNIGTIFNAGVAWMYDEQWTFVADIHDITDEADTGYAVGAEFTPQYYWTYRAGFYQRGNLACGLGYERDRWGLDAAWMENNGDGQVLVTGSVKF